jgi:hypothetical protein
MCSQLGVLVLNKGAKYLDDKSKFVICDESICCMRISFKELLSLKIFHTLQVWKK